jgi:UDP-2,3-diacylglucosamine pyrophosphatase LpxH
MNLRYLAVAPLLALFSCTAWTADLEKCPGGSPAEGRYLAVISDLHLGVGRKADGTWHRSEDFRWDGALRTFLGRTHECGRGRTDLVIAGDLLELWQPLAQQKCKDSDGCTVDEMAAIATTVLAGHQGTLAAFKDFATKGDNVLHVIPGNHDATLLLPQIWKLFHDAVGAPDGRVKLVPNGVWLSGDGVVLIEHGHQIGSDVNRYDAWPQILRKANGREFVVQPWGERFVQTLFNAEEETYTIIDNLSPESAGARYRMADRGLWRTAGDMARFLAFNLFETSIQQKGQFLGDPNEQQPKWDVGIGRGMGHELFANALDAKDPFRAALLADTTEAKALRAELDAMARDPGKTSVAEVEMLCDQIAIRKVDQRLCEKPHLGSGMERLLVPRKRVMADYLRARIKETGLQNARVFIYGHTHLLEEAWTLSLSSFVRMTVLNTGAFQRVVDEKGFLARAEKAKPKLSPQKALKKFSPEDLAPCYTAVLVPYADGKPKAQTVRWLAPEGVAGRFVSATDARCE